MRRLWRRAVLPALLLVLPVACVAHPVGPARTMGKYTGKAATTAKSALSVVETVRLVARAAAEGKALGTYVDVVVSRAEESLDGLSGTFGSIQPPAERADRVREALEGMLDDALGHVTEVRVAARRGELAGLGRVAEPLAHDAEVLRKFIEGRRVKKFLEITLGILTAIGGFVDIGDLVANAETGARFGMGLAWVVVVGVIGIVVYAEMAGRVAAMSRAAGVRPGAGAARARRRAGQPGGVVLHQLPHADGRARRRGHRPVAGRQRQLPAARAASRRSSCGS